MKFNWGGGGAPVPSTDFSQNFSLHFECYRGRDINLFRESLVRPSEGYKRTASFSVRVLIQPTDFL